METVVQNRVHLDICIADSAVETIGGHFLEGCLVHTADEIVVGEVPGVTFGREQDEETG